MNLWKGRWAMARDLNCLHAEKGLCAACQEEYDADPLAYREYGRHPEGERRWQELLRQIAADAAEADVADDGIPF